MPVLIALKFRQAFRFWCDGGSAHEGPQLPKELLDFITQDRVMINLRGSPPAAERDASPALLQVSMRLADFVTESRDYRGPCHIRTFQL